MSAAENAANGAGKLSDDRQWEELTAENARLREEIARLRAELRDFARLQEAMNRLEREKAEIAAERDLCVKSLNHLTWKDFTFTAEEIADLDKNGVTLDKAFFEDLERELRS